MRVMRIVFAQLRYRVAVAVTAAVAPVVVAPVVVVVVDNITLIPVTI